MTRWRPPKLDLLNAYLVAVCVLTLLMAGLLARTYIQFRKAKDALAAALPARGQVDQVALLCRLVEERNRFLKQPDAISEQGAWNEEDISPFLSEKARTHGLTAGRDFTVLKGRTDPINEFYIQTAYSLNFDVELDRRRLVAFLYDIEKDLPRMRVTRITLPDKTKTEDRNDLWKPKVDVTYRARKAGAGAP